MTQKELNIIIEKYLRGEASSKDIEILHAFEDFSELKNKKAVFQSKDDKNNIKARIFNNIQDQLGHSNPNLKASRKTYNLNGFKHRRLQSVAAVLIIGVIGFIYALKNTTLLKHINTQNTIVEEQRQCIKPGTDKATLTLNNGDVVFLEKEKAYQNQFAISNGGEIVYKNLENQSKIEYNTITIPKGGKYFVTLSDGTKVWLNSDSQLKYPTGFVSGTPRQVELVYGEAYFDVSPSTKHKGANFIVINNDQKIEVLGTEFNLKAYKDESNIYTTLVEGKVAVDYKETVKTLTPGEQSNVDLINNRVSIEAVDIREAISWHYDVFTFKGKPLKDIMKVLARWYNVDFIFENAELETLKFRGVLRKNQNLEGILEIIKNLSVIKNYEIYEKQIIIK